MAKTKQNLKKMKIEHKTIRQANKLNYKTANREQAGKTKRTAARTAAFATASANVAKGQTQLAQEATKQAQAAAEMAKYNALIYGNQYGSNDVDPTKDGTTPDTTGSNSSLTNPGGFR